MEVVECLSSPVYPGNPVRLTWEGERLEIADILSRWQTPDMLYFRVRTRNLRKFELSYRPAEEAWRIQPIDGG
jgi:hypothetical protein